MDDGPSLPKEISIKELRRTIDHQISTLELYQRQATLFLRISLATIGLLIASASFVSQGDILQGVSIFSSIRIENVSSGLELSTTLIEISLIPLYLILVGFSIAGFVMVLQIPIYTFRVAYPEVMKSGLEPYETKKLVLKGLRDSMTYSRERLSDAVVWNDAILNDKKGDLENAFESARRGILYLTLAGSALVILMLQEETVTVVASGILSYLAYYTILEGFPLWRYRDFRSIYWETTVPILSLILLFWLYYLANIGYYSIQESLVLFIISVPIIGIWFTEEERLVYASGQAVLFAFAAGIWLLFRTTIRGQVGTISDFLAFIFITSSGNAVFALIAFQIRLFISYLLDLQVIQRIKNFPQHFP